MFMRFRGGGIGHKDAREAADFFLGDRDDMDIERRANPNYQVPEDAEDIAEFEAIFRKNYPEEAAVADLPLEQQVDYTPDELGNYGSEDNSDRSDSDIEEEAWEDDDAQVETFGPEDGEDEEDEMTAHRMAQY